MYFQSFSELLHMGGHGGFVWFSYVTSLVVLVVLVVWPLVSYRKTMRQLARLKAHQPKNTPLNTD